MIREKLGRHDEARAIYDRLTQRYPDRPHYWIALGHSQRSSGEVDAAIASYRRAVAVDYECGEAWWGLAGIKRRSDEHTSELQSLMRISYAVFCLKKKTQPHST